MVKKREIGKYTLTIPIGQQSTGVTSSLEEIEELKKIAQKKGQSIRVFALHCLRNGLKKEKEKKYDREQR